MSQARDGINSGHIHSRGKPERLTVEQKLQNIADTVNIFFPQVSRAAYKR